MALALPIHPLALVTATVPVSALPLDIRLAHAEATVETAEAVVAHRGRELDARPSAEALRWARWAGEDLRDALDALEALRAEAVAA